MQPTRLAILKAIQKLSLTGWPPTLQEIGTVVGHPKSVVHYHVVRLEKCCYVNRRPGRVGILATDEGIEAIALSLMDLTQRASVARGRLKWDHKLAAVWRLALDNAKHGNFEIVLAELEHSTIALEYAAGELAELGEMEDAEMLANQARINRTVLPPTEPDEPPELTAADFGYEGDHWD